MIRFRFGIGILAVVLAVGIAAMLFMGHIHGNICSELEKASQLAAEAHLDDAEAHIQTAQDSWENHRHLIASLAEHTDMDEVDGLFRQLESYLQIQDVHACAAICAELSFRVEALGESHDINWCNIL